MTLAKLALYDAARLAEAGVHPGILARLTPRQIHEIYGHPRDDKGSLIAPKGPPTTATLAEELMRAEEALTLTRTPKAQREAIYEAIRARHAGARNGGTGGGDRAGAGTRQQGG